MGWSGVNYGKVYRGDQPAWEETIKSLSKEKGELRHANRGGEDDCQGNNSNVHCHDVSYHVIMMLLVWSLCFSGQSSMTPGGRVCDRPPLLMGQPAPSVPGYEKEGAKTEGNWSKKQAVQQHPADAHEAQTGSP